MSGSAIPGPGGGAQNSLIYREGEEVSRRVVTNISQFKKPLVERYITSEP
jgi:hypothetical protein